MSQTSFQFAPPKPKTTLLDKQRLADESNLRAARVVLAAGDRYRGLVYQLAVKAVEHNGTPQDKALLLRAQALKADLREKEVRCTLPRAGEISVTSRRATQGGSNFHCREIERMGGVG